MKNIAFHPLSHRTPGRHWQVVFLVGLLLSVFAPQPAAGRTPPGANGVSKPEGLVLYLPWTSGTEARATGNAYGEGYHNNAYASNKQYFAIDFNPVSEYQPVYPAAPGTVIYAAVAGSSFGNTVFIRHDYSADGYYYYSQYSHLNSILANIGRIELNTPLGIEGKSGDPNFSPHIHFALQRCATSYNVSPTGGFPNFSDSSCRSVVPEPFVGEQVVEGLRWWYDNSPNVNLKAWRPGAYPTSWSGAVPGWGAQTTLPDSSLRGSAVTYQINFNGKPTSEIREVRFTAWYANWAGLYDPAKYVGFDPNQTWRIVARCNPRTTDCSRITWNPYSDSLSMPNPDDIGRLLPVPWLNQNSLSVNSLFASDPGLSMVVLCISFDLFDLNGVPYYAPGNVKCSASNTPGADEAVNFAEPQAAQPSATLDNQARAFTLLRVVTTNPGVQDTTAPSAGSYNVNISSGTATLSAGSVADNAGGSGIREVRFSAKWPDKPWQGVGSDSSAPYSIAWDLCKSGVPDGSLELGMTVIDNAGNKYEWSEHFTNPTATKSYNCNPVVYQDGIYLYRTTGLNPAEGGECYVSQEAPSINNYCRAIGAGDNWNDDVESIRTVGPYVFALYRDDNYSGGQPLYGNFSGQLPDAWKNQASSIRIRRTDNPAFTLYREGDFNDGSPFNSDRTIFDMEHWGWNDLAKSMRVYSGFSVIVCSSNDMLDICGRVTGPANIGDLNSLAQGLRGAVSSVRVCPGSCPEAGVLPPLVLPANQQVVYTSQTVVLQWSGENYQFKAELWGGGLASALSYGWTSDTKWTPGTLPVSTNPYYWHVKAWRGYGETGWSETRSFYVQELDITPPTVSAPLMSNPSYIDPGFPIVGLNAQVSDNSGQISLLTYSIWRDNRWEAIYSSTTATPAFWSAAGLPEGTTWLSVDVVDASGNHSGLGNPSATVALIMDKTSPSGRVLPLSSLQADPHFLVSWDGEDNLARVGKDLRFDVQVMPGCSGFWTAWQSSVLATQAYYDGQPGTSYCFRAIARDPSGLHSPYAVSDPTPDAVTTVVSDVIFLPMVVNKSTRTVSHATVTAPALTRDGEAINTGCASWAGCRSAASSSWIYDGYSYGTLQASLDSGSYTIKRLFLAFDSGSIPADAVIHSAKLVFHTGEYSAGSQNTVQMVQSWQDTPLSAVDFNTIAFTSGGNAALTPNAQVEIAFNTSALGWIQKGGITRLALVHGLDFSNTAPTGVNHNNIYFAEEPTYRPYLEIVYSIP